MKTTQIVSGVMMAAMMALSGAAHAIAFQNPSGRQVAAVEKQVRAQVKANSSIYAPGSKIKMTYSAGQATIGMDRSNVRPELNVVVIGKKGQMGMANNHSGSFLINVAGKGAKNASFQQSGTWNQLYTVMKPATK